MSYIGKPAREQHSGRVLLAEYSITSSIQQIVIQQPFVNEGALYRQHEIEFISMLSNSNNNLAFQMHRDSDRQEDATFSNASDRQEFTGAMRECRLRTSGSNSNAAYNAGLFFGGKRAGATNKTWITRKDTKVRAGHAVIENKTVEIADSFKSGAILRFPGDPLAPPELVINCRCLIRFGE